MKRKKVIALPTAAYPGNKYNFLFLFLLFLLAATIRLAYVIKISRSPLFSSLFLDDKYYDHWAISIAKGNLLGKEAFYGLPLYPYFLGFVYFLFGHSVIIVRILQAIIDAFSCILLFRLGEKIFSKKAGYIACLIFIFYSNTIFYTAFLNSAVLAVFFNLLSILSAFNAYKKQSKSAYLYAGIIFGITSLINASVITFAILFSVWSILTLNVSGVKKFVNTSLALLGLLSVIAIPTARNYYVSKDFVPISWHSGITFYAGNNPQATGSFFLPLELGRGVLSTKIACMNIAEKESGKKLKPSQISSFWFHKAFTFIKANPSLYFTIALKKAYLFFWGREIPEIFPIKDAKKYSRALRFALFNFTLISPLAFIGFFISIKKKEAAILRIFILSVFFSLLIYFVNDRYKLPAEAVLILFAAYLILFTAEKIKSGNLFQPIIITASIFALFPLLNINFASYKKEVTYISMGISYAKQGKFIMAESAFKKAIKINPHNPTAHFNLGTLYLNYKKYSPALNEFQKTLEMDANYTGAYNNIGTIYMRLGKFKKAVDSFEKSLAINPRQENIRRAVQDISKRFLKKH